jgi:hypothetical protein
VRQRIERRASNRDHAAMTPIKIIGILLIVAGVLGLVFGSFSFTKETHSAKLGPLVLEVQERETVSIPTVLSGISIALGGVLLVLGFRNK